MAAAVPLLRKSDNKEYKNGSLMTMINSFQRGINEYKEKLWNEKVRSKQLPRDSQPVKFVRSSIESIRSDKRGMELLAKNYREKLEGI